MTDLCMKENGVYNKSVFKLVGKEKFAEYMMLEYFPNQNKKL